MGTQSTLANGWLQLNGKYWPSSRRRRLCSIDQNCRANKVQLYSPAAVSVLLKVVLYGITRPTADQTQRHGLVILAGSPQKKLVC